MAASYELIKFKTVTLKMKTVHKENNKLYLDYDVKISNKPNLKGSVAVVYHPNVIYALASAKWNGGVWSSGEIKVNKLSEIAEKIYNRFSRN